MGIMYYIMCPFEFSIPPSELDFSVCYASVVLVLIIPGLTLIEIARFSSDRQEQREVRPLKSAQQHCGSGRENDLNYKATYFNTSSQKQIHDEK